MALLTGCSGSDGDQPAETAAEKTDKSFADRAEDLLPDNADSTATPNAEDFVLPDCTYKVSSKSRYVIRFSYNDVVYDPTFTVTSFEVKANRVLSPAEQKLKGDEAEDIKQLVDRTQPIVVTKPFPQVDVELEPGYYDLTAWMYVKQEQGQAEKVNCSTVDGQTATVE